MAGHEDESYDKDPGSIMSSSMGERKFDESYDKDSGSSPSCVRSMKSDITVEMVGPVDLKLLRLVPQTLCNMR